MSINLDDLSLERLIAYYQILKYTAGAGKKVLEKVEEKIRERWAQGNTGVTRETTLADNLLSVSSQETYLKLRELIGSHWSLSLIKLGMRISVLNDEGKRKAIQEIRRDVYKKHGKKGIRTLNMASTGMIDVVVETLERIKKEENLDQQQTTKQFESLLNEWSNMTIFHRADSSKNELRTRIIEKMNLRFSVFFVFAYGSACVSSEETITELNKEGVFTDRGYAYVFEGKKDASGGTSYTWTFFRQNP